MAVQQGPTGPMPELSEYALRLTFRYEGMNVQLVAGDRVGTKRPLSEPEPARSGQTGFWVELRDAQGRIHYYRVLHNPIRYYAEVPVDSETGTLKHYKIERPHGIFQLLVPDIPEARVLILFSSPPEAAYEPAAELARFSLDLGALSPEIRQ